MNRAHIIFVKVPDIRARTLPPHRQEDQHGNSLVSPHKRRPRGIFIFARFAVNPFGSTLSSTVKTVGIEPVIIRKLLVLGRVLFGRRWDCIGYLSKTFGFGSGIIRKPLELRRVSLDEIVKLGGARLGEGITSLAPRCVGGPLGRLNWSGHFPDS